ncbi:Ureide permease 1, partial [Cucurbita argyrosperma subsp. argyrosperma]
MGHPFWGLNIFLKGSTVNYFLDDKINRAEVLFPGVACFLIAVCLGSAVHSSNAADNKAKLQSLPADAVKGLKTTDVPSFSGKGKSSVAMICHVELTDLESSDYLSRKAKAGSANYLVELENRRSIKVFGKSTLVGLSLTFFAGACFSLFSPAFNLATNDQWHTLKEGVPHLAVYTAFFYFSVSCFVLGVTLNIIFLYQPILNLPKTTFKAYLNDWNGRGWALLAGFLCGFGNGLQFMGGQAAEYRRSSKKTYSLLVSMLVMFAVAVVVLMASAGHRKESKVAKSIEQ